MGNGDNMPISVYLEAYAQIIALTILMILSLMGVSFLASKVSSRNKRILIQVIGLVAVILSAMSIVGHSAFFAIR
jgi:hypothetical protein